MRRALAAGLLVAALSGAPLLAADLEQRAMDTTRVAVFGAPGAIDVGTALRDLGLDPARAEPWPIDGWWLVEVPGELGATELVARISADPGGLFASPVFVGDDGGPVFVTPGALLSFDAGVSAEAARRLLEPTFRRTDPREGILRVESTSRNGYEVLAATRALAKQRGVRFAEPDLVFTGRGAGVPNDPEFATSWGLHNTGQNGGTSELDMDAPDAWTLGGGSPSVRVVVLDVGVEPGHPDLATVPGADFTGQGGGGAPVGPCDDHGTAVAGCIAGAADNAVGTAGVAPGCRVASARVFISLPTCDGSWTTQTSWTVDALDWARSIGARVTNNSNAYGVPSMAIAQKYADTRAVGLVHFAAAGDRGVPSLEWPASLPDVVAVSAVDRGGQLLAISSHGPGLALCAPGGEILTTDRTGAAGYAAGDFAVLDGTSCASAFAAGVAALALSRNGFLDPATVEQVLQQSAVDLGGPGADDLFGHGLVNAYGASLLAAPAGATERVHVGSSGDEADKSAFFPILSADGRYVAFDSNATNLVPNDTNGVIDSFVHDRLTGETRRVTVGSAGEQGNGPSGDVSFSGDGRWAAFDSEATNLVPLDTNGVYDSFVHDLETGLTERISVQTGGAEASGPSFIPTISFDGGVVAFRSKATDLVPGDTNGVDDCFVRDRSAGTTVRVSVSTGGVEGDSFSREPEVSGDGLVVAFQSLATNLVDGDGNGFEDVFVHELSTGTTERASVGSAGAEANGDSVNPFPSHDGRFVAFESHASNLVPDDTNGVADVFVRDRLSGTTLRASVGPGGAQADGFSFAARLSADGRFVGFYSHASNLVAGDTNGVADMFVHDRLTGVTERVSLSSAGAETPPGTFTGGTLSSMSWDGRFVAFENRLTGLVPGDANGTYDIFVRDRLSAAAWCDLGQAKSGSGEPPRLIGRGGMAPGATTVFELSQAPALGAGAHVVGQQPIYLPILGGLLVPSLDTLLPFATGAAGTSELTAAWPATLPSGAGLVVQSWVLDPGVVPPFAASNALSAEAF